MSRDAGGFEDATQQTAAFYNAAWPRLISTLIDERDPAVGAVRGAFVRRLLAGAFIVDVGAGAGRDVRYFRSHGFTVVGVDPSVELASYANTCGRGPVVLGDARALPLPASVCDAAWMANSLVHVPKAEAAAVVSEVRRVLINGSPFGIVTGEGNGEFWRDDPETGTRNFIAHYRASELDSLLEDNGFRIVHRNLYTAGAKRRLERIAIAL
jgi:hypothetical protein